jgi:hypothetical protein
MLFEVGLEAASVQVDPPVKGRRRRERSELALDG